MMGRVVALVNAFGDELEYDLRERLGLDLREDWFYSDRFPWEKLLSMAELLPVHGRYKSALHDDDEMAAAYLAEHEDVDEVERTLTLEGWTPERAQLVQLTEAVMGLNRTLIAVNSKGGKAPEVKPLPRPQTAWDRQGRRRNFDQARSVIDLFSRKDVG